MRTLFEYVRMLCLRILTSLWRGITLLHRRSLAIKAGHHFLHLATEFGMHLTCAYMIHHSLPDLNLKEAINMLIISTFYVFKSIIRTFF